MISFKESMYSTEFEAAISADFGHRSAQETERAEAMVVEAGITRALHPLDAGCDRNALPRNCHSCQARTA